MAKPISKIPLPDELYKDWHLLFDALNHQEDLICVVVTTSYLDHAFGSLLRAKLVDSETAQKLLKSSGPIGDLMAKVKVAYCIGQIGAGCRDNMQTITDIRNAFAHQVPHRSFKDKDIADLAVKLTMPCGVEITSSPTTVIPDQTFKYNPFVEIQDPRDRFTAVACHTFTNIMTLASRATHIPKRRDLWDRPALLPTPQAAPEKPDEHIADSHGQAPEPPPHSQQ